jgi:hypothetical protein
MADYSLILILLLIALSISIPVLILLFFKNRKLKKELANMKAIRESDMFETNQLFVEKSENELKLFFQFETALEELVKMARKSNFNNTQIMETLNHLKLLLEYQIKK